MLRLFVDTDLRLTELAALQLDDLDFELEAVYVAGTGGVAGGRTPATSS